MGNKVAANQAIQGALALNPTNAIAYLHKAAILFEQNDHPGAEAAWRIAKRLDPRVQRLIRNWRLFSQIN